MKPLLPLAIGGALGLGLLGAAWWLVGDLTSPGFAPEELDYMFRAPEVLQRNATTLGIAGLIIAVAAGALAAMSRFGRRPKLIVAGLGVGGAYLGVAARTFTAGGIGANIGAGLIVFLGIGAAIAWYAIYSWQEPEQPA